MHIPPDWDVFGILIVSFLAFWVIFGWLFFDPFLKLLGEREGRIKDLNERAERLLAEAKSAIEDREKQLADVRREALARRESERRAAETEAAKTLEKARDEARTALENVRAGIDRDIEAAKGELERMARELAAELAGRVLGRPVRANEAANN
ncbi:ATP synthase F0 subunit B [bacterium]|jgi:F-type H+-transporting ATPase subunit b|nr:ATP synthase F0 subunit B [bacterium]